MMRDWAEGYVTDIEYTKGFYKEQSLAHLSWALLLKGYAPPPSDASVLELAVGQGLTANILAASNSGMYWGFDFNPSQIVNAQKLAADGKTSAVFSADSFQSFCERDDAPMFDVITMHGIWSWITPQNRQLITQIIDKFLKPGGYVYVSYNCTPGWSPAIPMRDLFLLYDKRARKADEPISERIKTAIKFTEKIQEAGALYFNLNPSIKQRMSDLNTKNARYLAHEYFNENWNPMGVAQVADEMASVRMTFAASAQYADHIPAMNLTQEARGILNETKDMILRETLYDYFVNQQFRRDIYTKGGRQLSTKERNLCITDQHFVLTLNGQKYPETAQGARGAVNLDSSVYKPIHKAFLENDQPLSFNEIAKFIPKASFASVAEAITVLCSTETLAPAVSKQVTEAQHASVKNLNTTILQLAETPQYLTYLASPVTASGCYVSRMDQLFLRAQQRKGKDSSEWVLSILHEQDGNVLKDAQPIKHTEIEVQKINEQLSRFQSKKMPHFKRLMLTV